MNNFYVYEWFIKNTGEVFYVGKGTGKRYLKTSQRNNYFLNIINKYECSVKFYKQHLTQEESWEIEKQRIAQLKRIGQAKANFHVGGRGGDTGYRPKGKNNPFYGRKHSEETVKKIKEKQTGKRATSETRQKMSKSHQGLATGKNNPMYGKALDKNPKATPILVIDKNNNIVKRFTCRKEILTAKEWKKTFPRPNGTPYILKCLKEGLDFHGYKLIYEKDF